MMRDFLPISRDDMKKRGWDELDFVYVIGDAYVDHPSFGPAIISRVLEAHGYKVCIISQPDWKNDQSVMALGVPRLGFLVSAGNMDSMVNHYTVSKKRRHQDAFTPGGVYGKRPDYAAVVYGIMLRRACPEKPIIVGGIEASLRRLGHYAAMFLQFFGCRLALTEQVHLSRQHIPFFQSVCHALPELLFDRLCFLPEAVRLI